MRPYLRAANVTWDGLDIGDVNEMNFPPEQLETFRLQAEDILLSEASGSASEVGKPALWRGQIENCCFQNTLIRVRSCGPDPRYLLLHFKADAELGRFSKAARGVGIHHLGAKAMEEWPLRLAPFGEQGRIVDEVEKQFTRLDAAVTGLQRVKANLKRYRASVLKAACEGRLVPTEAELARREARSFESGEELLKRILKERRARWEADQLAKMMTAGRIPRDGSWRNAYRDPSSADLAFSTVGPEGWALAAVGTLAEVVTGFTPPTSDQSNFGEGVPFLKPTDLNAGYFVREGRESLTEKGASVGRVVPERSVLVTCIGATIGKTGFARVRCATNQQVNAVVVAGEQPLPEWLYWAMLSPGGQEQLLENSSATTLPIIKKSRFEGLPVPLPPLTEQHRIVAEIERRLSVVDELEAIVEKNLARCARLRQSILKMAFDGRLVPQYPNDEPAIVLLERIRSTRAAGAVSATSPSGGSPRGRKTAKHP